MPFAILTNHPERGDTRLDNEDIQTHLMTGQSFDCVSGPSLNAERGHARWAGPLTEVL